MARWATDEAVHPDDQGRGISRWQVERLRPLEELPPRERQEKAQVLLSTTSHAAILHQLRSRGLRPVGNEIKTLLRVFGLRRMLARDTVRRRGHVMPRPLVAAAYAASRAGGWLRHPAYGRSQALRWSLSIVFIWFGILKPLGVSPAADLVARTIYWGVDPEWFVPFLGWWEVAIGVCLIVRHPVVTRIGILLMFLQMPGTFLPVVLLPDVVFTRFPFELTLEGQYIVKNLVLISAALAIGGTVNQPSQPG